MSASSMSVSSATPFMALLIQNPQNYNSIQEVRIPVTQGISIPQGIPVTSDMPTFPYVRPINQNNNQPPRHRVRVVERENCCVTYCKALLILVPLGCLLGACIGAIVNGSDGAPSGIPTGAAIGQTIAFLYTLYDRCLARNYDVIDEQ
jgi:hypothetical protein